MSFNIRDIFLQLTEYTVPYKMEHLLIPILEPFGFKMDQFGNFYLRIGERPIAFTAHSDTVGKHQVKVNHIFERELIKTDSTTILGADDKAGLSILLDMISDGIEGHYIVFAGEEVRMSGSIQFINSNSDLIKSSIKKVISFDRKGYDSIITHQMGIQGLSDRYASYLLSEFERNNLSMKLDPTGKATDSFMFHGIVDEITNISVGYFNQHTKMEYQDIEFLAKLSSTVKHINW